MFLNDKKFQERGVRATLSESYSEITQLYDNTVAPLQQEIATYNEIFGNS